VEHLLVPHTLPIFISIKFKVLVVLKSDLKLISSLLFLARSTLWECYIRDQEGEEYFHSTLDNWLGMKLSETGLIGQIREFLDGAKEKKSVDWKYFPLEEFLDTYKDNVEVEFTGDVLCQHINGETNRKCEQIYLYCFNSNVYQLILDKIIGFVCVDNNHLCLYSNDFGNSVSWVVCTKEVGTVVFNVTRDRMVLPPLDVHQVVFLAGSLNNLRCGGHRQFRSVDDIITGIKSKKAKIMNDFLTPSHPYRNARQAYITRLIKEEKWNITNVFWHEKTKMYREFMEVNRIRNALLRAQRKAAEFADVEMETKWFSDDEDGENVYIGYLPCGPQNGCQAFSDDEDDDDDDDDSDTFDEDSESDIGLE
jgi:hypothetical protein